MNDTRHHRQRILPEVGEAGQGRLRQASVLVVGLGALGSAGRPLPGRGRDRPHRPAR